MTNILKTNLTVLIQLLAGLLSFAGTTFISLSVNGYHAGLCLADAALNGSLLKFLLLTIPHGVFEIPAIIIAGAAGFKIMS